MGWLWMRGPRREVTAPSGAKRVEPCGPESAEAGKARRRLADTAVAVAAALAFAGAIGLALRPLPLLDPPAMDGPPVGQLVENSDPHALARIDFSSAGSGVSDIGAPSVAAGAAAIVVVLGVEVGGAGVAAIGAATGCAATGDAAGTGTATAAALAGGAAG